MHHLTRDRIVYSFDRAHPPVLEVDPGAVILIETEDARTGTIQTDTDLLVVPPPHGGNPATGPVFVRGAEPGDSLVVEIRNIALDDHGFLAVKRDVGLLRHRATAFATRIIPVRDGVCHFNDRIRFPIRPMVGVLGTAPAGEGVPTMLPGPHGGNMDNNEAKVGARVHLPVAVPGALLGLGDVHASMGDGEISMVGFEIRAEVTAKVDLQKGATITRPWIETADGRWVTTGDDPDPEQAMRIAVEEMVNRVMRAWGLSFEEAYMLVTARADLIICQACQPGDFPVTTRVSLEKLV
jgi:amidase